MTLTACGGDTEQTESRSLPTIIADTSHDTFVGILGVITEPFEDIGLKSEPIPTRLEELRADPYKEPHAPVCLNIKEELLALNQILGPDDHESFVEKDIAYGDEAWDVAQKQALGYVHDQVSIIPFRGVVRRVSGAEKHQRQYAKAYEAGRIRRAFLRGLSRASHCT